ncbi:hypothetical protein [uncultured Tateyamaria sp.]|uniref:hypothetical protein n=1 Tax=uncultured Tateyamaria sp. TaxID=455651 RepID=UPI00260A5454|nr:hypothetical protein [uncultured Tateyamaria sp.]
MIDFLSSLSWVGWLLIALGLFTLWHLPSILKMALFGDRLSRNRITRDGRVRDDIDSFHD